MKICFLSWHFKTPQIFLDYLIKQTPGKTGKWKDLEATTNPKEADFVVILDGYKGAFPEDRAIYFGAHPYLENYPAVFRTFRDKKCVARVSLDKHLNPVEWWCEEDYDFFSKLQPPKALKTELMSCIITYQTHTTMHTQRVKFLRSLFTQKSEAVPIALYGRPAADYKKDEILKHHYKGFLGFNKPDGYLGEHTIGKSQVLKSSKYTLDIDVGPTRNYASERLADSWLWWCLPIYFGSTNLEDYFPKGSFAPFNLYEAPHAWSQIYAAMRNHEWEASLSAIQEARDLILNRYNFWAYTHHVIHNVQDYQ